jgi:hypothetical protein
MTMQKLLYLLLGLVLFTSAPLQADDTVDTEQQQKASTTAQASDEDC